LIIAKTKQNLLDRARAFRVLRVMGSFFSAINYTRNCTKEGPFEKQHPDEVVYTGP